MTNPWTNNQVDWWSTQNEAEMTAVAEKIETSVMGDIMELPYWPFNSVLVGFFSMNKKKVALFGLSE